MKSFRRLLAATTTIMFLAAGRLGAGSAGAGDTTVTLQAHADCRDAFSSVSDYENLISFDSPAKDLVGEGLPIGNGRMGMLIQGGIDHSSDAICEDSVWSGWRNDTADNPDAANALPEIRQLFDEGKIREAQDLINKTQVSRTDDGKGNSTFDAYGTYEMLARLEIDTGQDASQATHYLRRLSLNQSLAYYNYAIGQTRYFREYFSSRPDEVQCVNLHAKDGTISFRATLTRADTSATVTRTGDAEILLSGTMHAPVGKQGLSYACRLGATAKGGTLTVQDGAIVATNCDTVILYITAATNYKGIGSWPDYLDKPEVCETRTKERMNAAIAKGYDALYKAHLRDFAPLFERVSFHLTPEPPKDFKDKEAAAKWMEQDKAAFRLENYFQFGRYLLISSSRSGDLPANLQGLWAVNTKDEKTGRWGYHLPWESDYHANVNIQMNYWPAYEANLAECAGPLYDLIGGLPGPGAATARTQHGCDGWTTHTMNNVWGYTSPGWEASWGHFPMAGPWLATHIWTGYASTLDTDFLARMWPTLKGSALFVLSWLTQDKDGQLVSGPSESPENRFRLKDGSIGYFCMGPSMDQELCAQLLDETLRSAQVLGIDDDFTKRCADALAKIRPVGIGPDGRLLEWTEQYDEPEPGHRHTSHLFGLYPGTTISLEKTPELAAAARKSLEYRIAHGGGYTGWSRAMIIGEWARLHDGEKAYENLQALLDHSTLPNLFDTHPPFQIDGNFGATAAMIEMLMQSRLEQDGTTTIELLPALPSAWPRGQIQGIVAQGAVTVGLAWEDGQLACATLKSAKDIDCHLRYAGKRVTFHLTAGEETVVDGKLRERAIALK